jgi:hypothetical protein
VAAVADFCRQPIFTRLLRGDTLVPFLNEGAAAGWTVFSCGG